MSSKPTNEEVRQQRRLKHMEAVQDKSRQMLEAVFPNPDNVPSEAYFLSGWDRFNQSLMETFGQQKDFRLAFNHGINLVIKYQKKYGWPYSPPSHLITNKPPAQLRSPKWLKSAWAFYDAYDTWLNEMGNVSGNAIDIRYQSLMLSLLCDSGQCNADVLRSFSQQLQTHEKLPLTRFSDYTFTTLTLNNEALNTNDKIKGEMVTTYQCYLSGKTLGQLKRWQKLDRSPWQAPADSKALLAAVSLGFQKNTHFPTTLKELCSCSVYWYERHRNPDLSEALLEYRVGRTHSYSLPASNIARLVAPTLNTVQSASFDDFSTDVSVKPRRKKDWSTSGVLLEQNQFIRKLKQACKPHEGGEKVSSQRVTDNLNTLLGHYQFAPWQQAFIQWLRLKSHGCAPKTVNQYMLNQVKFWCLMNTEQELASITSPPELEVIYQEQINRHPTRKSQGYYAKRLKDLHAFASPLLGLPALRNNFFHIETGQRHTRAGLIDEPLFKALLRHIHELTDLNETDRLALQTICIIAYRCGLRINELYKLQIKNREPSPTGWLEIRANRFGDNKTASGFRKVPLFPLLLTHEHTIVTNYLGKEGH